MVVCVNILDSVFLVDHIWIYRKVNSESDFDENSMKRLNKKYVSKKLKKKLY